MFQKDLNEIRFPSIIKHKISAFHWLAHWYCCFNRDLTTANIFQASWTIWQKIFWRSTWDDTSCHGSGDFPLQDLRLVNRRVWELTPKEVPQQFYWCLKTDCRAGFSGIWRRKIKLRKSKSQAIWVEPPWGSTKWYRARSSMWGRRAPERWWKTQRTIESILSPTSI